MKKLTCKCCSKKLGIFYFKGNFCSNLCKLKYNDEKRRIQSY